MSALLLSVALVGAGAGTAQASGPVTSPRLAVELPAPPVLGQPTRPAQDSFYRLPSDLHSGEPGDLIRSRLSHVRVGVLPAPVRAWQVLYRSTSARDEPNAVSGTVLVPGTPWLGSGPRPIVSYTIGTHGLGDQCAPSYQLASGTDFEFTLMSQALAAGWAVVVTDYEGLGTPGNHTYVVQRSEGRAALDIVRAATGLRDAGLSKDAPVGIWGYSQGGGAAGKAAEQAADYAPELDVRGVAAGGVPADLVEVFTANVRNRIATGLLIAATTGFDAAYPELALRANLTPTGQALYDDIRDDCVDQIALKGAPFTGEQLSAVPDPVAGAAGERLRENGVGADGPSFPAFVYHGGVDELIPVEQGRGLTADWCAGGTDVEYLELPLTGHIGGAVLGGQPAVDWLAGRFAGSPAPSSC